MYSNIVSVIFLSQKCPFIITGACPPCFPAGGFWIHRSRDFTHAQIWNNFQNVCVCVCARARVCAINRSSDLWQPEEVDRVHADEQHPGNIAVSFVHHCWRPTAARHHHNPLHRPRHRHGAGHLTGVRSRRKRHHEATTARPSARQTCQRQVPCNLSDLWINQSINKSLCSA